MRSVYCVLVYSFVSSTLGVCAGEGCGLVPKFQDLVNENQFRCDYTYSSEVDGWLKYHEIPANWYNARLRCHLEGTTLASPLNDALEGAIQDIAGQLKLYSKRIFTGIHSTFSKGDYFSIEGVPLSQITHEWSEDRLDESDDDKSCLVMTPDSTLAEADCDVPQPYVCYKTHNELDIVNECGTIDNEYVISNVTGSCYKFHTVPRTWSHAHMACSAEGAYLTIINSNSEAQVLRELFEKYPPSSMVGNFEKDEAFIGFHDWGEHGEFLTINGQTLKEAGYDMFSPGQPNNFTAGQFCGAIYRNALLDDLWCENYYPFICEKNPESLLC